MENDENLGGDVLRVGRLALLGRALLAPMAGVTDAAMRAAAERYGAAAAVSEMIAAAGVKRGDRETRQRLGFVANGATAGPRVVQIAARDAPSILLAARAAVDAGADWIDINMGCPCKRVTGGLAGSALMCDLDQATRLIAAVTNGVEVPVSVKMRLGWDDGSRNAPQLARRAEAEGAALVTVHGRTRQQFYTGVADWAAIAAVKQAVRIPVIANGDCDGPEAAAAMLRLSGADAVMIGRAAQGQPWLVGDIATFLRSRVRRAPPALQERLALALEHLEALASAMGAEAGLRHARKHLAAYVDRAGVARGERGSERRRALLTCETPGEARVHLLGLFAGDSVEPAA